MESVSTRTRRCVGRYAFGAVVARNLLVEELAGLLFEGACNRETYARERSPTHVSISGERPIALQMIAVVCSPILRGQEIVARRQQAPTMRMRVKKVMKYQLELLRMPWRKVSRMAINRQGT